MKAIFLLLSLVTLTSGYTLVRHGKICDLCIDTLKEVESAITSDQIEKLVEDISTEVCAFVPKAQRDSCRQFVSKIIKENFNIIKEFTELWGPEDLCQMVMLCPKSDVAEVEGKVCTMCTDVVAVVRYLLTDPALETMIKTYAETACSVTGPLAPMCKKEIDQLVDLAFSQLKTMLDNFKDEDLCKAMHLCKHDGAFLTPSYTSLSSSVCDACTATVNEIESVLAMDELEKLLEDISGIACSLVPYKPVSEACVEMTQDILEEVFYNLQEVLKVYDGDKICHLAHFCKSDAVITTGLEVASVSPLCEACEDALHLTRKTLTDPALEAAVNADVKLACAFTGFLHKKCEEYTDAFTSSLFGQVRQTFEQFDDHKTCVLFDFCADTGNKTTVCDVCMDSFTEVSEFVKSETMRKLVTDEVDYACRAFGPLSRICKEEANKVINVVFGTIDKVFEVETAERFCSQIHLCPKPALI